MTTIRTLITDAYRESGIIPVGEELDADIFEEGLRRLNALYDSLFGHDLGEPLLPLSYGTSGVSNTYALEEDVAPEILSSYIPANVRLILNIDEAVTLYLPPNPDDGARFQIVDNAGNLATYNVTLDANGRRIEDALTVTLATNDLNRSWFYRGDLGKWVRVTALEADDESPFPAEFDDFLVTLLAYRMGPRHGAQTADSTIEVLKRMKKLFRARYKQKTEQPSELGLYRLTSDSRYWTNSVELRRWNRGI